MKSAHIQLSAVVPLYNEGAGLTNFHALLVGALEKSVGSSYEVLYCDDGSQDDTVKVIEELRRDNLRLKLVKLSRNFGKESALAAGIALARGEAIIMIDGDGQHPAELIPDFVDAWKAGSQVVIGVRTANKNEGWFKHVGSSLFYNSFNKLTRQKMVPGSTDFRLIDGAVQRAFLQLRETDRITRGLIDWLGFDRSYIPFTANERQQGSAGYSRRKLVALATNSFVSLTSVPLHIFGYLGVFITGASLLLGTVVGVEQLLLGDPLRWRFTGTAMLSIMLLFLVGVVLLSQGMLALYISHIHNQSKQRPLYVIDYEHSAGLDKDEAAA
jgi:glycosyltransferase involved in cell wall biosynthesis